MHYGTAVNALTFVVRGQGHGGLIQGESKKVDPLQLSTIFSLGLSLFA